MKCKTCNNEVQPIKKFSWIWFIVTGVFPYLLYYIVIKNPKTCPACGKKFYGG